MLRAGIEAGASAAIAAPRNAKVMSRGRIVFIGNAGMEWDIGRNAERISGMPAQFRSRSGSGGGTHACLRLKLSHGSLNPAGIGLRRSIRPGRPTVSYPQAKNSSLWRPTPGLVGYESKSGSC